MYLIVLAGLALLTGIIASYTNKVQATTLWAGKILAGNEFAEQLPTGFQDAITPKSQNTRNLLLPILLISILVFGSFQAWYLGVTALIVTFFIYVIAARFISDDLEYYLLRLISAMDNREADYRKNNDSLRADAAHEMSEQLRDLLHTIHGQGMKVPLISDIRKM